MKRSAGLRWMSVAVCGGLLAVAIGTGCQKYVPPAGDFKSSSFSERDRSEADTVLRSIDVLSLEDAQKIALLNNPNYAVAYHSVTAAKMRYYQSFAGYMPQISMSAGVNGYARDIMLRKNNTQPEGTINTNVKFTASANWMLFDGLAREFGVMAAKHGYNSAQSLNDDSRRQLLLAVAQAYYDILLANANRRIALEDMSFQLKNLRETEIKHQYGAVPLSDVLNFQIQVNQADSNRLTAEYNYSAALFTLAALMGYPEGTLPDAIKFPEIDEKTPALILSVDTYLDMALANRPDLKAYREQLTVSKYNLYQTYSAFAPTISAFASYGLQADRTDYNRKYSGKKTGYDDQMFNYGLTANWVLFDGLRRFNVSREAQANMAAAEYTVAQAWLAVVNDVRLAYANYDLNIKQANLYSAIRKLVFQQRELVQAEYDAGQAEIVRLNEAQRNVVSAEGTLVQARANVQKARAQLEAAANINNLGRGYEAVRGASATLQVLADNGMQPKVDGLADQAEIDKYTAVEMEALKAKEAAAEAAAEAAEKAEAEKAEAPKKEAAAPAKEIVGPPAPAKDAKKAPAAK